MAKQAKKMVIGPKSVLPEDVELGRRIRLRRIELGLSQSEIGAAVGVSFQQIQKYETGQNRLSTGRMSILAEVLRVPKSFFYEDGSTSVDFTTILAGEKKSGVRLIQAFSKIKSETVQRHILAMVEAIADDQ